MKKISVLKEIINDTLKRKMPDGTLKWSRTSLTMASAWFIVVVSYSYSIYKEGFRFDAFCLMVGVALGSKLADSTGKRIEKPN